MKMKVSIVIPAHNESYAIVRTIREIANLRDKLPEFEIIVVDDGSSDGTAELVEEQGVKVVRHMKFFGYGRAMLTGFEHAVGDILVTYDADGTYDSQTIPKLIQPILEGSADLVIGSRFRGEIRYGAQTFPSPIGNRVLTIIIKLLLRTNLTDGLSSFRAIRRESLSKMEFKEASFDFVPEFLAKSCKAGLRITEVPTIVRARFSRRLVGLVSLLYIPRFVGIIIGTRA